MQERPSEADGGSLPRLPHGSIALRPVPRQLSLLCLLVASCAGNGRPTELSVPLGDDALEPPLGRTLAVTGDLRLAPGEYLRPATGDEPVLLLEGLSGVELDLTDVVIRGQSLDDAPDSAEGIGLIVRDCDNLVLRGGELSGYRIGLLIEGSRDVRVEGLEVQDFFAKELFGTLEQPHSADRLDLDDSDSWLENYGAAIAVVSSSTVTLEETRSRRGQNGVVWINVQGCELTNSDHSYLSGWGVALVESVGCTIANNRFDACTRGVSGDAPPDGMGAAGVMLGKGCERNVIAYNVARACGDGLRVQGDGDGTGNLWFGNDLSGSLASAGAMHGAANERIIGNRLSGGEWRGLHVEDCDGVVIYGNEFEGVHGTGLSLVSSRECLLVGNQLIDCDLALLLRGRESDGDYDCVSNWIVDNEVSGAVQDVVLERARELVFDGNRFDSPVRRVHLDGLTAVGVDGEVDEVDLWNWLRSSDSGSPSGRATDVQLAPAEGPRPLALEALSDFTPPESGSATTDWRATEEPSAPVMGRYTPWDPEGEAERPAEITHGGLVASIDWKATWFPWDASCDPRGDLERWRALRFTPRVRATVGSWNDPWGGAHRRLVGDDHFGLYATGKLELDEGGRFLLGARSDDGLRVTVDGEVVLESWIWKPAREEVVEIELDPGTHALVLEYFQIDGPAVLQLSLDPLRGGATGSTAAPDSDN
jgi:parallel beta helix pectate lyase-like protein/PA14 domain-containing protein